MDQCPEQFEGVLIDFIDGIEWEVNEAKKTLDDIRSVEDLHMILECRDRLAEIGKVLY